MPHIHARPLVAAVGATTLALVGLVATPVAASAAPAADVRITEFAYGGLIPDTSGDGEYVEITNLGDTAVDLTGWSYNTSSTAGGVGLSGLGTLAAGESAIITDVTPDEFRAEWGLSGAVPVVNDGSVTLNKGPKTLYLFDSGATAVDSVSYVSGFFAGKGQSAWVDAAHVGAMSSTTGWTAATVGDQEDSWTSTSGAVGSPGVSSLASLSAATANVKITEFAYGGLISGASGDGEYVEITNVGRTPVDMTGWSYNTANSATGAVSLSAFGTLAAGESALVTDVTAAQLRSEWGLGDAVKIVNDGSVTLNKGPKTIYLLDAAATAVDSVSYASGFESAKGLSAWVDAAHLGAMAGTTGWTISTVDDQEDSWTSTGGAVGSPGTSSFGIHTSAFVRTGTDDGDGGTTPTTPTTDPNYADITINEVTSDNTGKVTFAPKSDIGDAIELYNGGTHDVSVAGWTQIDSGAASEATDFSGRLYVDGALSTVIPAGGYGVFQSGKGLGSGGDAVKIYTPDGTLVDEVTYLAGQAGADETVNTDGTYKALARCLDGQDTWLEVSTSSFGASNDTACATGVTPLTGGESTGPEASCDTEDAGDAAGTVPADVVAWPGSAEVATIDTECDWVTSLSGQDLSGLAFDPADANVLYAVKNKSHVWRLVKSGDTWVKDTTDGWSDGKDIVFPSGSGQPDSEGLTVGSDGMLYITTERDNLDKNVPLDTILQFDPNTSATTLTATAQWVLTADLGFTADDSADANLGFEGLAYVPDSELVSQGFRTDAGDLYDPADYPGKVTDGVFFGAIEKNGHLHAYVLNSDGSFVRLADVDTGMVGVMDAAYDADLGAIWAHCDNTCGNATTLLAIGDDGHFAVQAAYAKPAGLPNYNLEGFAVAPASTAVDGQRQVLWTDDGNRYGHSLWAGTLPVDLGVDFNAALTIGSATVAPGSQITVTGSGLTAGSEYSLSLHSDPVLLGTAVAAADGTLTLTALVPMSTLAGSHSITIALTSNPTATLTTLSVTVTAAGGSLVSTDDPAAASTTTATEGSLAVTGGSDWSPWAVGATIVALLGAALVFAGRRFSGNRRSA